MSGKPAPTRTSSRTRVPTKVAAATAAAAKPTTTRTTRARAATSKQTTPIEEVPPPAPVKKAVGRKPLEKRENVEVPAPPKAKAKSAASKAAKQAAISSENDREPITAYLRIRPRIGEEPSTSPYLIPISDTSVRMTDPQESQISRPQYRSSVAQPTSIYTFSHVFPDNTIQSDFFTKTTLPLVKDLLHGQNGLLFTYGVTNSGKTYTVQGGTEKGTAGILPRTLDVVFNSIEGLHGDGKFRPVRLYGVEPADATDFKPPQITPEPALAQVLQSLDQSIEPEFDTDPTVVAVDRNYQYIVWLSYAEVYNEKVYDLLASAKDGSSMNIDSPVPRAGNAKSPVPVLSRQALPLRPSPASDNLESELSGKYVAGLRHFRIHSAAQAKSLVKLGQLHRRVFGTLANRESSRSHGMVILKIIRGHRGEKDDPSALQVSRLTLVDLAGSERTKHTHTTGDRLKEAGNINKSLMVLGQCMEVLRSNQRKLAMSLAHEGIGANGRMDTRDVKRTLAVVPFRHSKLTEALMDYFVGDGRVVMTVNINPYDTGYDENSHVMKFAALTREIYVTPAPAPVQKLATIFPGKTKGSKFKEPGPAHLKGLDIMPKPVYRRKVTISMGASGNGNKPNEATLEVLEEEEAKDEDNDDDGYDDPGNPLVDALFDEVERLGMQLFEAEMRCAIIEAETREEVMREMEDRMRAMEQMYSRRLMTEFEQNELKTDAKIDMLHQAGLFASPTKQRSIPTTYSEEEAEEAQDVEMSLVEYGPNDDDDESMSDETRSRSASPLARKEKEKAPNKPLFKQSTPAKPIVQARSFVPDPPALPSDGEDAELTESEDSENAGGSETIDADEEEEEEDDQDSKEMEEDEEYTDQSDEEEEEEEWVPPPPSKPAKQASRKSPAKAPVKEPRQASSSQARAQPRVSKLARDMDHSLKISESVPRKKARTSLDDTDSEDEEEEEAQPIPPKKKRQLAKKPIVTVDSMERVTWEAEKLDAGGKSIRRLGN